MRVFITGGASGIGYAMAKAFRQSGAEVAVTDTDEDAIEAVHDRLPGCYAYLSDVRNEASLGLAIDDAAELMGGLDVICANAGTGGPAGEAHTLDAEEWRTCIDVNLTGAWLTAKHAIPYLKRQKSGLILFTTSTAGLFGYPNRAPYAAAKWALVGLTKTLAMELGSDNIRVNAIAPGAVQGDRMERVLAAEAEASGKSIEEMREAYVTGVSMKSWVKHEDIAATALFLASPGGRRISGQVHAIDGHTETLAP